MKERRKWLRRRNIFISWMIEKILLASVVYCGFNVIYGIDINVNGTKYLLNCLITILQCGLIHYYYLGSREINK